MIGFALTIIIPDLLRCLKYILPSLLDKPKYVYSQHSTIFFYEKKIKIDRKTSSAQVQAENDIHIETLA